MRHTTDTLPERGVLVHHFARSLEKWYGILVLMPDRERRNTLKGGLDEILGAEDQRLSFENGDLVTCKGAYSQSTLKRIKRYLSPYDNVVVISEGKYEHFLGNYWIEEVRARTHLGQKR